MDDLNGEHLGEEERTKKRPLKQTVLYGDFAKLQDVNEAIRQSHRGWGPYGGAPSEKLLDMERRLGENAKNGFSKDNPHPLKITIALNRKNGPESEIQARVIRNTASEYGAVGKEREGQVDSEDGHVIMPSTPYPNSSDDEDEDADSDVERQTEIKEHGW